jgi:hypothetical protein
MYPFLRIMFCKKTGFASAKDKPPETHYKTDPKTEPRVGLTSPRAAGWDQDDNRGAARHLARQCTDCLSNSQFE